MPMKVLVCRQSGYVTGPFDTFEAAMEWATEHAPDSYSANDVEDVNSPGETAAMYKRDSGE